MPAAEPTAPELPAAESPASDRPPPDPTLIAAVTRDLALGRRVVELTWLVALLLAGLCLVALREAALLVHADSRLVITSAVQDMEVFAGPLRFVLALAVLVLVGVAARWLTRAIATMEALAMAGAVDDGPRRRGGLRRVAVLFRPAGVPADHVTWRDLRVGSGRRLVVATLIVTLVAIGWTIAAVASASAAASVDDARSARYLAAFASGSWIVATILAGAVVADVTWRMAVAARAVGAFAPMSDAPGRVAFPTAAGRAPAGRPRTLILNAPQASP